MFYNSFRATRTAFQKRQYSAKPRSLINPRECLINKKKRKKLKNLLMTKFIEKYNIKDPNEFLDLVVTQFIQGEKLNDIDLKKLDLKINRLNKEFNNKSERKNTLQNLIIIVLVLKQTLVYFLTYIKAHQNSLMFCVLLQLQQVDPYIPLNIVYVQLSILIFETMIV